MIIICRGGYCGMLPKTGSIVAGVYMILMTNMYIIFETAHLDHAKQRLKINKEQIIYYYYTALFLAGLTYPICFLLIFSVWSRTTWGMLVYIIWIIFYDLANFILLILIVLVAHKTTFSVHSLEWSGLICRLVFDCFWLSYVLIYTLMIFESRRKGRMSLKIRHLSRHAPEPPKYRLGTSRRIQ